MEKPHKSGGSGGIHPVQLDSGEAAAAAQRGGIRKQHGKPCKPYPVCEDEFAPDGMEPERGGKNGRTEGVFFQWGEYAGAGEVPEECGDRRREKRGKNPEQYGDPEIGKEPAWGTGEISGENQPQPVPAG